MANQPKGGDIFNETIAAGDTFRIAAADGILCTSIVVMNIAFDKTAGQNASGGTYMKLQKGGASGGSPHMPLMIGDAWTLGIKDGRWWQVTNDMAVPGKIGYMYTEGT